MLWAVVVAVLATVAPTGAIQSKSMAQSTLTAGVMGDFVCSHAMKLNFHSMFNVQVGLRALVWLPCAVLVS